MPFPAAGWDAGEHVSLSCRRTDPLLNVIWTCPGARPPPSLSPSHLRSPFSSAPGCEQSHVQIAQVWFSAGSKLCGPICLIRAWPCAAPTAIRTPQESLCCTCAAPASMSHWSKEVLAGVQVDGTAPEVVATCGRSPPAPPDGRLTAASRSSSLPAETRVQTSPRCKPHTAPLAKGRASAPVCPVLTGHAEQPTTEGRPRACSCFDGCHLESCKSPTPSITSLGPTCLLGSSCLPSTFASAQLPTAPRQYRCSFYMIFALRRHRGCGPTWNLKR